MLAKPKLPKSSKAMSFQSSLKLSPDLGAATIGSDVNPSVCTLIRSATAGAMPHCEHGDRTTCAEHFISGQNFHTEHSEMTKKNKTKKRTAFQFLVMGKQAYHFAVEDNSTRFEDGDQNTSQKGPGESGHSSLHLKQVSLCKPSRRTDFLAFQPEKNWLVKQEFQNLKSRCGFRTEELCTQSRAEQRWAREGTGSRPQCRTSSDCFVGPKPPVQCPHLLESIQSLATAAPFLSPTFFVPRVPSGGVHGGAAHSAVQGRENLNLWEQLQVTPKQDQIRDWLSTCSHSLHPREHARRTTCTLAWPHSPSKTPLRLTLAVLSRTCRTWLGHAHPKPCSGGARGPKLWEPREWNILQPARLRHTSGNSRHSGEETSPPLDQHQHSALGSSSGLLDELLSATDIQEKVQPFLNADAREEEPPGIPEAALSKEEFQALLDMLPSSTGPQT
ncbi:hypothetical protein E2I00_014187 [Balaenoptera physalus]|uniref:Uncharacterized protein n=1 Tax=Balaenoptera physalus TaxID=9770 RepID=A0A643BRW8_BALPH|nr:hypothetical protein E2I00_014187 [Balaenoptera physalus]